MSTMVHIDRVERDPMSVVTVGTFDGVHQGHRELIGALVHKARQSGCRSVVVTFDPHPREILQPGSPGLGLLTTPEERAELLAGLGVDTMVVIPFNRDFSLMDSVTFIESVIYGKIGLKAFIIGYDHHFGHNREGDSHTLAVLGERLGFTVDVVQARQIDDKAVSSSSARRSLVQDGDTELVQRLLGRPYRLAGVVVQGDARGRTIGFPTANISLDDKRKIIPKVGVYAVKVDIDGRTHQGMMNIGYRPTFGLSDAPRLEVHVFDFSGDLYGKNITVHFVARIRDERKFEGVEALVAQLENDREVAKKLLN